MEKKESYRHILPHFQQPSQAYFVTWCLKDSIPPKALSRYTLKLQEIKFQIENHKKQKEHNPIPEELQKEYSLTRRKYVKAYDDLLAQNPHLTINLNDPELSEIIVEALRFWEGQRLENHAFSIMPNHIHWVFQLYEKDNQENSVYLQDIMQSVKRQTANKINKLTDRKGKLWQKESFDITIRDEKHLMNAIEYTLNNPIIAGFVKNWNDWPGCWCAEL